MSPATSTATPNSVSTTQHQDARSLRSQPVVETVQAQSIFDNRLETTSQRRQIEAMQASQPKANSTGLPDKLKSGIESLSGYTMDDVKVHYNSTKPAQLSAYAYAQGCDIHLAPGQERHLPHEAWHVVQQKQGRVAATTQLKGEGINTEHALEQEATSMGAAAMDAPSPPENSAPSPHENPALSPHKNNNEASVLKQRQIATPTIQAMFKRVPDTKQFLDDESGEVYEFCMEYPNGNLLLKNDNHTAVIDKNGTLLEKHNTHVEYNEEETDELELDEEDNPTLIDESQSELLYDPYGTAREGIMEKFSIGKLSTDFTAHVSLLPLKFGKFTYMKYGPYETKFGADMIWVNNISLGDQDRPETRFDNQESHTVSWTLVRNGIMGLAGQELSQLLSYLQKAFSEIAAFIHNDEGEILLQMVTTHKILESIASAWLPIDIWQRLVSRLIKSYFQVYQLSSAATYKRGLAKGHGEAHARKNLEEDELAAREQGNTKRKVGAIAIDAAKLLDVQFRLQSLGVDEYAFAIYHWIDMLQHAYPHLMTLYQDDITKKILEKEVSPSFKQALNIDNEQEYTVRDLVERAHKVEQATIGKHLALNQFDIPHIDLEQLNTSFTANVTLQPDFTQKTLERQISDSITIPSFVCGITDLTIKEIAISDSDRPKTKFIQAQKSHTVPWTLSRNTMMSYQERKATELASYLYKRSQELEQNISNSKGKEVADTLFTLIKNNAERLLPVDDWHVLFSECVRLYMIAYQVADSTTYVNPNEGDRALGHGEGPNMAVLRRNEFAIENYRKIVDSEERIIKAITGMFDAQITSSLSARSIKIAFECLQEHIAFSFPYINKYFAKTAYTEMGKSTVDSNGTLLQSILDDDSLSIDSSGFLTLDFDDAVDLDTYTFPEDSLVTAEGTIRNEAMGQFVTAYRADIATTATYLTEAEGNLLAQHLGIQLGIYQQLPDGYQILENPGHGDCLIHALVQACAMLHNTPPPPKATTEQITELRKWLADHLPQNEIENLMIAAVAGYINGQPEPGLGPYVIGLLNHISVQAARKIKQDKEIEDQEKESMMKESQQQFLSSNTSTVNSNNTMVEEPPILAVSTIGIGLNNPNIALLHQGAHYRVIYKP
ncbi:hypothetical protein BTA51_09395 [Hahella sp. CCB-MM4]|uniref:eCIS core domain-containing protein n=1 Tax=Hahella sp. (strain CCB-MM4) TaxID=1926491 RepID=UPI000B9B88F5|nr:DUF4157 domain-containing protein [Hahella sp. CCB-MM4]OZG73984.1 hypothetical protein BTA51_09395 [Hahella sp. CCB-MM4]